MSQESDDALQRVRAAKPLAEAVLTDLLGKVAIGITRIGDDYGLKVNLASAPSPNIEIPSVVAGVPIRIEVTGPISKRPRTRSQK